jgi:hypothetical protein
LSRGIKDERINIKKDRSIQIITEQPNIYKISDGLSSTQIFKMGNKPEAINIFVKRKNIE